MRSRTLVVSAVMMDDGVLEMMVVVGRLPRSVSMMRVAVSVAARVSMLMSMSMSMSMLARGWEVEEAAMAAMVAPSGALDRQGRAGVVAVVSVDVEIRQLVADWCSGAWGLMMMMLLLAAAAHRGSMTRRQPCQPCSTHDNDDNNDDPNYLRECSFVV